MAKGFWLRFELGEWFALVGSCNDDDHTYEEMADIANRGRRLQRALIGRDIKRLHNRVKTKTRNKGEAAIAHALASALGIALV